MVRIFCITTSTRRGGGGGGIVTPTTVMLSRTEDNTGTEFQSYQSSERKQSERVHTHNVLFRFIELKLSVIRGRHF